MSSLQCGLDIWPKSQALFSQTFQSFSACIFFLLLCDTTWMVWVIPLNRCPGWVFIPVQMQRILWLKYCLVELAYKKHLEQSPFVGERLVDAHLDSFMIEVTAGMSMHLSRKHKFPQIRLSSRFQNSFFVPGLYLHFQVHNSFLPSNTSFLPSS